MSKVKRIEQDVQALTPKELAAFRRWFREFDAEAWDRQVEEDAKAGKLDTVADTASALSCEVLRFPGILGLLSCLAQISSTACG